MEKKGTKGFRTTIFNENGMILSIIWEDEELKTEVICDKDGQLNHVQLKVNGRFSGNISCYKGKVERDPYYFSEEGEFIIGKGNEYGLRENAL